MSWKLQRSGEEDRCCTVLEELFPGCTGVLLPPGVNIQKHHLPLPGPPSSFKIQYSSCTGVFTPCIIISTEPATWWGPLSRFTLYSLSTFTQSIFKTLPQQGKHISLLPAFHERIICRIHTLCVSCKVFHAKSRLTPFVLTQSIWSESCIILVN